MLALRKTSPLADYPKQWNPIPLDHNYPEESMEYKSLSEHCAKLHCLIQRNPEKFAADSFSAHIISARVLSCIRKCGREEHCKQTIKLLKSVKKVVRADPGKFGDFVEVVQRYSPPLAKELEYTCGQTFQLKVEGLVIKFTPDAWITNGSFGDIWKGTRSGSPCAVKTLPRINFFLPPFGNIRSEKRERFEIECELSLRLSHPNVVRFLQKYIHPESGTPLLAMELMDENLTSFLERQRETSGMRLSECVQVKIGSDVAQALDYLHANHIVHRNLTSNNVLLLGSTQTVNCQSICAKVSDFGHSGFIASGSDQTLSTIAPGAQGYIPPESWKHDCKFDEKSDMFMLGVLMLQTVTMLPPNPSDRAIWRSGSTQIVPEVKRREVHLKQIAGHPLEYFARCCLQEDTTKRPTAHATCRIMQKLLIQCRC